VPQVGNIMSMEWGWEPLPDGTTRIPMTLTVKCVSNQPDFRRGTVAFQFMPLEDTIHPVPLRFPCPMQDFSTDEGKSIRYHWEKLTYVFELSDPANFPTLNIPAEDRALMEYFIETCRNLAGYSAINDENGLTVHSDGAGRWDVEAQLPPRESFAGTSVTFRQLHSGQEEASFDKVKGKLYVAIKNLPPEDQESARTIVTKWAEARADLMNKTLNTIVCYKATPATGDNPVTFRDIRPEELIAIYNYGGTIHFGDHRDTLVDITRDRTGSAYYGYACMVSIVGLSNLYFGFAELLESALGRRRS